MVRVTGPAELQAQARRNLVSAVLGLGGIVLALALTFRLERSLRRSRAEQDRLATELRQAEHLAWLGRLLAGVAHEVRNPLAGIRSTVQLWQRLPETARSPAALEAIVHNVDRLEGLVGRLLLFARSGHEPARPADLGALVGEAFDLLRARAAEQKVELIADLEERVIVQGAAGPLGQVVLNLLLNALQAMPAGGRVTCRTRRVGADQVELTVIDTGPGVPAEVRAHLFEPFFTTRAEGTGLGLALCREIVEQHGGRIDLVGDGPGATFRVVLPAQPGGPA
jgi:two-component system sensor histidine kinase AtoS